MSDESTTALRILDAAEAVLRRHGFDKTNVVDVAKSLGMSHGNIYRHFPSKQALMNAVVLRWVQKVEVPLDAIAKKRSRPATKRLADWFNTLRTIKQQKLIDEPELFRSHHHVVEQVPDVVKSHIEIMRRQIETIIADGIASGEFSRRINPGVAARAFLQASSAFHHPVLMVLDPPTDTDAQAVLKLLLAGLKTGAV